ncbi:hypothetical protein GOP47_0021219 [Adiantum capillus-veneris]|uniref:Uncharacterized protein n=1 Tax=Adiantum capillus-veneris TaxID=13818 RepID=A0A9D4UAP7_ADICA|nr:hypothetical protein GOP47_0021219 [Adiantum capillus-veneris]
MLPFHGPAMPNQINRVCYPQCPIAKQCLQLCTPSLQVQCRMTRASDLHSFRGITLAATWQRCGVLCGERQRWAHQGGRRDGTEQESCAGVGREIATAMEAEAEEVEGGVEGVQEVGTMVEEVLDLATTMESLAILPVIVLMVAADEAVEAAVKAAAAKTVASKGILHGTARCPSLV